MRACARIPAAGRFVQDQQLWIVQQCLGQQQSLFVPGGKSFDHHMFAAAEICQRADVANSSAAIVVGHAIHTPEVFQILLDVEVAWAAEFRGHKAERHAHGFW